MPQLSTQKANPGSQQKSFVFDGDAIRLPQPPKAPKDQVLSEPPQADRNEANHGVETSNALPRASQQLVRPDRQVVFDGLAPSDWPPPRRDPETISVDRTRPDVDGPPHRFVIRLGDVVELFVSTDDSRYAEVLEVCHAREEVRIAFREGHEGAWFHVSQIYPAPIDAAIEAAEPANEATSPPVDGPPQPVPEVVPHAAADSMQTGVASHKVYSLEAFREYRQRYEAGSVALDEYRAEFARVQATREEFIADLKSRYDATQLKSLAARFGCWDAKRNSKQQNAHHIHRALVQSFCLGDGIRYDPMRETLEQAVVREVAAVTEEQWQQHLADKLEQRRTEQKSHENPESLEEFRTFVRDLGVEKLSDEQRVRFDELLADHTREARKAKVAETVTQISSAGTDHLAFTIKQGWHDRHNISLWIVQISERVEREAFNELNRKAKMLGGWYSSFKKSDAGFQFKSEELAARFASLLHGDADRSDVLADRQARKLQSNAERLREVAETLAAEAESILSGDDTRLKNTVRRAEMAAGMRGEAYVKQAMAGTLRRIADALDNGEAKYLDGVWAATHVTALVHLLRRGKSNHNKKLLESRGDIGTWGRHQVSEELQNRPFQREDAAFVEYPYPTIPRCNLQELVGKAASVNGLKQRSDRMHSFLATGKDEYGVLFVDHADIEFLLDFLTRARSAGLDTRWLDASLEDYKRLRAARIDTPQELRCALRELVSFVIPKQDDDPIRKAEEALIGREIPGFFPTPRAIISRMLELAEVQARHRVLEPSAGKGDILDFVCERHPDAALTSIEFNATLHEVLSAKGHDVHHSDFLEHSGEYDRIVMNPPFEDGQDMDHVRHAFAQLATGGRLVSVMSEGPFFRQDRKAAEFREWLNQVGGTTEELPDDAFRGAEAFRQTGVRTRLVVIDK